MIDRLSPADVYRSFYQRDLEDEAGWLAYGAIAKVDSIERLLRTSRIRPSSLLELGCGTGSVIAECQRRGLADEFVAIDYAPEAIAYLANHTDGIRCTTADLADPAFSLSEHFDVVILSHVLEHLDHPLDFLRHLAGRLSFRYLIAEVPLEDMIAGRLKNLARDRTVNTAGHVQFFNRTSIRGLLRDAGFAVRDEHRYVPVVTPAMLGGIRKRHNLTVMGTAVRLATNWYLPRLLGPLWKRTYYAHYAALCEPSRRG